MSFGLIVNTECSSGDGTVHSMMSWSSVNVPNVTEIGIANCTQQWIYLFIQMHVSVCFINVKFHRSFKVIILAHH